MGIYVDTTGSPSPYTRVLSTATRGVTVVEGLTKTTAEWNAETSFIPTKGQIIIYSDYDQKLNPDGTITYIPGIKIGDAVTLVQNLPFTGTDTSAFENHINDTTVHVTQAEKDKWNQGGLQVDVVGTNLRFHAD